MLELLSPLQVHQPRFAPADPEFVIRYNVAGGKIKRAEHDLRLVIAQRGDARSAIGAKASAFKCPEFARAFSCKPGNALYKDPAQTCKVW